MRAIANGIAVLWLATDDSVTVRTATVAKCEQHPFSFLICHSTVSSE